MIENRKQQHIGIFTPDIPKMIKFYTEELGFVLYQEGHTDVLGVDFAFVGSEDKSIMFELLHIPGNTEMGADGQLDHFCFDSQDIEADYAECVKRGYKFDTDGIIFLPEMWDNGVKFFKFFSETGQIVEYAQIL